MQDREEGLMLPTPEELEILRADFPQHLIGVYRGKATLKSVKASAIVERLGEAFGHGRIFTPGETSVVEVDGKIFAEFKGSMNVFDESGELRFSVPLDGAWLVGHLDWVDAKKSAKTNAISKTAFEMWGVAKQVFLGEGNSGKDGGKDDQGTANPANGSLGNRANNRHVRSSQSGRSDSDSSARNGLPGTEHSGSEPNRDSGSLAIPGGARPSATGSPGGDSSLAAIELWAKNSDGGFTEVRVMLDDYLIRSGLADTKKRFSDLTPEELQAFDKQYGAETWNRAI